MSIEAPDPKPGGDRDARTFGMLCHLLAFAGLVVPFGNIIGPLVIWLIKREEHPFVDEQGKEALNFQISVFLYAIVCGLLSLILIGIPLLIALGIFWLVVVIIASVKANGGESYRYPLNLRLIK
ncbi:MAG: DUF4870 domain-containing protein [Gammaproteobacteria bacterium]|nr:MAG: DUF4870 domain-containing protein [Gammaproteobacteria bacterium]